MLASLVINTPQLLCEEEKFKSQTNKSSFFNLDKYDISNIQV